MSELFCNACWNGIKPGETALSTSCAHLFCQQCAGGVTASGVCTCCDGPLTPESIKEVRVLVDGDDPRDKVSRLKKSNLLELVIRAIGVPP